MNPHVNPNHIHVDPFLKEAIEFWSNTLKNYYNENEKVPIMYLIGHRGNAPRNIMSNLDTTEENLRNFLVRFPDHFLVTEDTVMLKKVLGTKSLNGLKREEVDTNINQYICPSHKEVVEFWSKTLKKYYSENEKVPIMYLIGHRGQAPPNIMCNIDTTEENLRNFLVRFPEYFVVTKDTVMLKKVEVLETKSLNGLKRDEIDSKMKQHIDPSHKEVIEFWSKTLKEYYNENEKVPIMYLIGHRGQAPPNIMCNIDTTKENLRNFLVRFPEYFVVTKDTVMLKKVEVLETKSLNGLKRDEVDSKMKQHIDPSHKEVIEFWSKTLKEYYNENEKVPIMYLIGHRGQAPPNIMCNIDTTKENLRNFLVRFPEYFVVTKDTVMLKKVQVLETKSLNGLKRDEVDSKMKQHIDPSHKEVIEFWSKTLKKYYNENEKVPIMYLIGHRGQAPPNIMCNIDTTKENLRNFLVRFPDYFVVTKDTVMLKKVQVLETKSLNGLKRDEVDSKMKQHIDPSHKEVIEFWSKTLKEYYNENEKVPIMYLIGHRGQAPPNIMCNIDTTKENLRNFLVRFPEYFVVTKNTVMLKKVEVLETKSLNGLKRDGVDSKMNQHIDSSHKEVIEFWSKTLKKYYNENEKVPIMYLIGHRGHAPPNIMSNLDTTEEKLRNFLVRFPDHFLVTEDTVMLKEVEVLETKSLNGLKRDEVDSKMKQHIDPSHKEVIEFWSKTLKKYYNENEKVPIMYLIGHRGHAPPNIICNIDTTEKKLRNFLIRFPEHFVVTEDTVMLKKVEVLETKSLNGLKRDEVDSKINQEPESPLINPRLIHNDLLLKEAVEFWCNTLNKYYNKNEIVPTKYLMRHREQAPPNTRNEFDSTEENLRNFLARFPEHFMVTEDTVMLKNFKTIETKSFYELKKDEVDSKMKDKERFKFFSNCLLKKRPQTVIQLYVKMRPYILQHPWYPLFKTPEDVSSFLKMFPRSFKVESYLVSLSHEYIIYCRSQEQENEWMSQVLNKTQVISSAKDCANLVDRLMNTASPIAFDSEWDTNGLTLLQIAEEDGRTYIIDLLACSDIKRIGRIDKLLSSNSIIKIMHDCRQDQIHVQKKFGIILQNVFDTQIAYSYLQHQKTKQPVQQIPRIGLNALYELYGAPTNPFKEDMKGLYIMYPNLWKIRPLTRKMKAYAASDVQWLHRVYWAILKDLNEDSKTRLMDPTYVPESINSIEPYTEKGENQSSLFNTILFCGVCAVAVTIGVTMFKFRTVPVPQPKLGFIEKIMYLFK